MSKRRRILKIKLEAEKCLMRKGELAIHYLVFEVSQRGNHYLVTSFELAGILRSHERIVKVSGGVYAIR